MLVHSDYNGLNILMQHGPEGCAVSAVLDWEEAFSWNRYVDIANMLNDTNPTDLYLKRASFEHIVRKERF
ncbi:phosphotransferase [Paenibacillus sp. FSL W7-1279]|uniref:phosphotransferase n=1 Tax=Paenibacillus sp. FSL W7-1279 TaxID=2921697 RepID=UPI0030DBF3EC